MVARNHSPHERELRAKATEFILKLRREKIVGLLIEDSFRQYHVKLELKHDGTSLGKADIFYSGKKKSYKIVTTALSKEWQGSVEAIFHGIEKLTSDHPKVKSRADIHAYVDGSYHEGVTGYGVVILRGEEILAEMCGACDPAVVGETRQVAGELTAVVRAISWCKRHRISSVEIYFDYQGVESWATRAWKANLDLTKKYGDYIRASGIEIIWRKVKSHTGDKWNDHADELAKRGTRMEPEIRK